MHALPRNDHVGEVGVPERVPELRAPGRRTCGAAAEQQAATNTSEGSAPRGGIAPASRVLNATSVNRSGTINRTLGKAAVDNTGGLGDKVGIRGMKPAATPLARTLPGQTKTDTTTTTTGESALSRRVTLNPSSLNVSDAKVGRSSASTDMNAKSRLAQVLAEKKSRAAHQLSDRDRGEKR